MLIETGDLRMVYQVGATPVHALTGVAITVDHGEFVVITGASGSGKSTLLNLLGCLERPSGGWYRLEGKQVEALDDDQLSRFRNQKIGFVFQTFNLIPQYNVVENVELPLIYRGVEKGARRARSLKILEQVGLGDKIEHRPSELSGGEAQRVAIARALAVEPVLLLADEPTGNLDSRTGTGIMELFSDLNRQGATVILVTHSQEVAGYGRRTIEMRDGRIIHDSATGENQRC
ncbi:MAG: ABC transporter ATP-binding protein [Geobacteraceae bacterium]|nr:ABC transporter ATP-binding protein [Geobacteraceae bacterium]